MGSLVDIPRSLSPCGAGRGVEVVRVILLSWMKDNPLLRLSEGSLRRIRREQAEKVLKEEAERRHAQQDLNTKPK